MISKEVMKIIKDGGVGVLPTDTLYGLVGSVFSEKAVKRVYQIKKRNPKKPCIILISSLKDLNLFGVNLRKNQETFLKTIWPGKISVILEVGHWVGHPKCPTQAPLNKTLTFKMSYLKPLNQTLAFRMPKSVWLNNLLEATGPLIAPSCNEEGKEPAQTIEQAKDYFTSKVDFYFDKGKLRGEPSTLIALKGKRVIVVRQGGVNFKDYELKIMDNKKIKKDQFLVSITTTKGADWKARVKEIDKLKIEQLALFVTCVGEQERKELYQTLEKTFLKEIPFCHIRSDMPFRELDYLTKRWQTKVFNLHTRKEFAFKYPYDDSKYKNKIFIENVFFGLPEDEIKKFGGICLDFSHLENDRLIRPEVFKESLKMLEKYKIGCNHISGIFATAQEIIEDSGVIRYDKHLFTDLKDFAYLKKYPLKYFSKYCALEVENSLESQLTAIDYIVNLIL